MGRGAALGSHHGAAPGRVRRGHDLLKLLDITEFHSPVGGGVTTYLQAKARWLQDRAGVEHVVVVSSDTDRVERWHGSRVYHVAGRAVPASPGFYFLTALNRLREILRRERPDVIEIGSPLLAPWMVKLAARGLRPALVGYYHCDVRAVYVEHGLATAPNGVRAVAGTIADRYVARVYGACDHTITATPTAAAALTSAGVGRVSTIPLGVDTRVFHPDRRDPAWKHEIGATPDTPVALYVGRLAREKELDTVLAALPALHREHGIKLVLIGEGHMRESLERHAQQEPDTLTVLPFESDRARLARAYASADLYVDPFPYETFGLSVVEAMASGLPVAAVDAGGVGDVTGDGVWTARFAHRDSASVLEAVGRLLSADRSRVAAAARRVAVEQFSWDKTFERQVTIYRRLANGNGAGVRSPGFR